MIGAFFSLHSVSLGLPVLFSLKVSSAGFEYAGKAWRVQRYKQRGKRNDAMTDPRRQI